MNGSASDDTQELLLDVARQFKEETDRIEEASDAIGADAVGSLERVEQAKRDLAESLQRIRQQQQSAHQAASAARDFYETWRRLAAADEEKMQQRRDDFKSLDDPRRLREGAADRREESDAMAKVAELLKTSREVSELLRDIEETLEDSHKSCIEAEDQANLLEEEMKENALREERRRQEEEEANAMRKAEEIRRRQEEEERQRREAERMERQQSSAAELQRRRQQDREQRRLREEAESDRHWQPVVFEAEGGEFEFPYGCAVRAPDGAFDKKDFRCHVLRMDDVDLSSIPPTEEVVGNVVLFESAGLMEMPASLQTKKKYWIIMVPHCAQRMSARETVIYALRGDTWVECPSVETHVDHLEHQTRWVEARITEPTATVVPVNKLKTDRFNVGKAGLRFSSSVDNRVSINIPEDAVKIQLDQTLEVQPIDSATLSTLRAQHPKDTANLLTTSSIIQHTSIKKNAIRPITFTFPVPLNPLAQKKVRPGTAAPPPPRQSMEAGRPKTAAAQTAHHDGDEDDLVLLIGNDGARGSAWNVIENAELEQESGKDTVSYRTARIRNRRFIALRVTPDFNPEVAPRLCAALEASMEEKTAVFILRQKSDNLTEVMAGLAVSHRLDRALKNANEFGYDYEDPVNSAKEVKVRERQQFNLRFRGNIVTFDEGLDDPSDMTIVFNSQLKNLIRFTVSEKDRFAQRALDQYRGFLDFHTEMPKVGREPKKSGQSGSVTEEVKVASLLINIPKSEEDLRVKSPRTTPFTFKPKDSVSIEYLENLAERLNDHWELLAEHLEIDRKRCSVIKGCRDTPEQQAFEMLITWVKRQQVSKKKAPILYRALRACNLLQLAEELRDLEQENRRSSARNRDSRESSRYSREQEQNEGSRRNSGINREDSDVSSRDRRETQEEEEDEVEEEMQDEDSH